MFRIAFLLLILAHLAIGQSKPPVAPSKPITDPALVAKVDSLVRMLEREKLASEYAKETLQAYKEANENIRSQYGLFVGSTLLVFLAGFGGLGWFLYQRSEKEREFIASETEKLVMPRIQPRLDSLSQQMAEQQRAGISHYQEILNSKAKADELEGRVNRLVQMESTVIRLDITLLYEEFTRNKNLIEVHTFNKELDRAYRIAIGGLKGFKKRDDTKHFGDIYLGYTDAFRAIFHAAKGIKKSTKDSFEEHLGLFAPAHATELKGLLDIIPVEEEPDAGGLVSLSSLFAVKEGVF